MRFKTRWLVFLLMSGAALADTTWVNDSLVSGTWSAEHSPYMILRNITVDMYDTLSIGPGVIVFFTGVYSLTVRQTAHFSAIGTQEDSILFTTDTIAYPAAWGQISIEAAADTCRLHYCIIERSGTALTGQNGALHIIGTPLQMRHCTMRDNHGGYPGALHAISNWHEITDCHFYRNSAIYSGAMFIAYGRTWITDCVFEDNQARAGAVAELGTGNGGSDTVSFVNCIFRNNNGTSLTFPGGAISASDCPVEFTGCTFDGNTHLYFGGALSVYSMTEYARLADCRFLNNVAPNGGAIYDAGGHLTIERTVFDGNSANFGGALYATSLFPPWIRQCTFIRNHASGHGGAMYCDGQAPRMVNSIVAFNESHGLQFNNASESNLRYNLFFGNESGPFFSSAPLDSLGVINRINRNGDSCDVFYNLYLNPLFADTATGDCHLTAASPCIDAGDPTLPFDPDSTIADIGAFYFPHTPDAAGSTFLLPPSSFGLSSYPNPFNAQTTIRYALTAPGEISLTIYDLLGREVVTLLDKRMDAGSYAITWNAAAYPSGMYFAILKTTTQQRTQKLLLLK